MKILRYFITLIVPIFFSLIIFYSVAGAANKIMPLGDSITRGIAGSTDDTGYRRSLYFALTGAGYTVDFVGSLYEGIPDDFDKDHEGHGGWTAEEIIFGDPTEPLAGNLTDWLDAAQPEIVLLHIGTNGLSTSSSAVEAILNEIDAFSPNVWVVLARIINRSCSTDTPPCTESTTTMTFNDNVEDMALARINDKIVIVDMEVGADIDYLLQPVGDMADNLHPFDTGYSKLANVWFSALEGLLPQADAGDPQTVKENVTVTLDGSNSSDPDGTIVSYLWEQETGTPVTLPGTSPNPTATFDAPDVAAAGETLTFKLTVTDTDDLVSSDTVSIDVINTINPVADAGDVQNVTVGDTVTLDGVDSSDADGTIVSYVWEEVTTTGVMITNDTTTPTATFTAPDVTAAGETLTLRLTVTDDDGLADEDTMNVNVDKPLLAVPGDDQNVTVGDLVTLDGTASTGPIASYEWIQTAGSLVQLSGADTAIATFTYTPNVAAAAIETLTFTLTVEDNTGSMESSDSVIVNVDDGITPSTGGGGGGGGGCFISAAAEGSPMALDSKVLSELPSRHAMVNWKRLMAGNISRLTPRAEQAATPAIVVTMAMLIGTCIAITLRKHRKRWLKQYHHDSSKKCHFFQ